MKMKKSLFLTLAALFATELFALDFEVDGIYYITNEDNPQQVAITFQKAQDDNYQALTTLTIPETVTYKKTTYQVVEIGKAAFAYAQNLTSVEIPATIVEVGPHAFYGCSKLNSVKFNKGLTKINKMAFAYSGVEEIVLPDGLKTLGDLSFAFCEQLKRVSFPNDIEEFGNNAFKDCTSLEKIRFADRLKEIGDYAFTNCTALKKVVLPNGLKNAGKGAFSNCTNLTEVTLSKDMKDLGNGVFENCNALANIQIPAQNPYLKSTPDGVLLSADGKSLFYYPVGKLDQVYDIPDNVVAIGPNAFGTNNHVNQINVHKDVVEIGTDAFANCKSLKKITLAEGIKVIRKGAFANCSALSGIVIPKSVCKIEKDAFTGCGDYNNKRNWKARVLYIGDCLIGKNDHQQKTGNLNVKPGTRLIADQALDGSAIVEVVMPDGLEIIGERAFYSSAKLVDIDIPESVKSIAPNAFDSTAYFNNDKNWKNGILYIDNALIRVDPEIDGKIKLKKVTIIADQAFANCSEVTEVKINDATAYIGKQAFLNCTNLQEINVPKQLKMIEPDAFQNAENVDKAAFLDVVRKNNPQANELFDLQ